METEQKPKAAYETDVAVIGGGIIGTLILRALSQYRLNLVLLEQGNDFASGATRANSAVIHAGFDPKPNTAKARTNVLGSQLYPSLCAELSVPYHPLPSLVAAYAEEQAEILSLLLAQGNSYGVPGLSLIGRKTLKEKEPNIADSAVAALFAPSSAIISPWEVAIAAAENACENGAQVRLGHQVTAIRRENGRFILTTQKNGECFAFSCLAVVNAAGVAADDILAMLCKPDYTIQGRRGHYFVLDKQASGLVNHILFPCPTEKGKGVLILPEYHGRIMLGPDSAEIDDKTDVATVEEGLAFVSAAAQECLSVPIPWQYLIRTFSGVRPTPSTKDFIIRQHPQIPGFIEAAGMESPGLAAAPAVAFETAALVADALGGVAKKAFQSVRQPAEAPEKPDGGVLVCRCGQVTRRHVRNAMAGPCGAKTVKGVKLRTGAMAGGCQGGFCLPAVVSLLAESQGILPEEVLYDGPGSYVFTGPTRGETNADHEI